MTMQTNSLEPWIKPIPRQKHIVLKQNNNIDRTNFRKIIESSIFVKYNTVISVRLKNMQA